MNKHSRRKKLTLGTLIMLAATALALLGCAVLIMFISGRTLDSQADELTRMLRDSGVKLAQQEPEILRAGENAKNAHTSVPSPLPTAHVSAPREQELLTMTLAAGGSVFAPRAVRTGTRTETGEYDFRPVFAGLGDVLVSADLAIATLETMTAGEEKGYGNYNAPTALLDGLRQSGVDVISLGTEHALDKGYDGLEITRNELTSRGLTHVGTGESGTTIIGVNGIRVAVLAYTYGLSEESKESAAPDEQRSIPLLDVERMTGEIRQARADGANVVIVLPHWGTKNKQETPQELRTMARELAAAGADVILGTHPNVVQGTERLRVRRADGLEYETVVCYSLGSLLCDARTEENTAGMIAHLQISYDPAARRVSLGQLACVPVYIARQKADAEHVYRVIDAENAQALAALEESEQAAAAAAVKHVRSITGQSRREDEGEG